MSRQGLQILFESLKLGDLTIPNRLIMASLTRMRGDPATGVPNDLFVEYYSQRASAGLIISECSAIAHNGDCFLGSGGIYNKAQVKGWKKVTDAVHNKGGRMFLQIWHAGRAVHPHLVKEQTIGPSAIAIRGMIFGTDMAYAVPKEMTQDDIKLVKEQFRQGAQNAKEAGFDGVELHGANGYLIDQFLRDGSNHRKDIYGGSVENRNRFCLEVLDELISVYGPGRVGIKLSPVGRYQDMHDSDPIKTYSHLVQEIEKKGIAYIQFMEPDEAFADKTQHYERGGDQMARICHSFRPYYSGNLVINNNLTPEIAAKAIESGDANAASFGRYFISNPDFVERVKNGWPLNKWDAHTFYTGGAKGYTDYPFYKA